MDALTTPSNWQRVRLGDIAEIKRGASPRPIENPKWFCANSNVGWVRISDISKNSRFLYKTAQKLSKKGIEKSRLVKQNSLIMSMCATIGKPIITKIDTCIHDGFVVFENPKIDLNYLYYFICYIEKEWLESGQQGSQVNLNVDLIKNKEVFYPKDLNEQIAIANILSDVDRYLYSLDALILKKEGVKKALSFELLSQRKRLKGFNQNWQRVRLGDIAEIKRGASPRPIENPKWFCANSNVGWVRISDISKNSRFLYKTAQKLSKKGIEKSRLVKQNSLIMSMCATIGKPIITKIDTCIHDGFVVFENPKIDLNYLYYFICYIEKEWLESGQQGSQVNLNVDLIKNKEVFYPKDLNEQIAIANILSDVDNEITSLKNKKRQFENIKKALNHDLMSAKIRVLNK
ncbi:restriction endonuclease subunit S [Helicobacter pylori]|uniref:restriction endonuclease subunit S n=1 Tax=Helicobacter pylori TaxID=210 RepID=UPI00165B35D8|nr:restriction endonuclease subunit S [Helicobacter pylori]